MTRIWSLSTIAQAAAIGATAFIGTGCDARGDEADLALASARGKLAALNARGHTTVPASYRAEALGQIGSELRPALGSNDPATLATAHLLMAEVQAGQGALAADEFRLAALEILRQATIVETRIDLFLGQHALAHALSGYDPTDHIARFDQLATERTQEHAEISTRAKELESRLQALLDEAEQYKATAEEKRVEAGALRTEALNAGPADRARLVAQAQEVRREREALFVRAENLEAEADRIEPELQEIRLELERVDLQLRELSAAREHAGTEAAALGDESEQARRDAEDTGRAAARAVEELIDLAEAQLSTTFDEVIGKYDASRRSVQNASRGSAAEATRAASSAIQLARASILREQSENLARIASVIERASNVEPPLPVQGDWIDSVRSIQESAEQYRDEAAVAYQDVADALRRNSQGGDPERMELVARRLEELGGAVEQPEAPPQEPPQPEDSPDPS